jgi:ACS family hexuronate transporter-like MFS transporter
MTVFLGFALLALLSFAAAFLERGPLLIAVLLVLGLASLGVFPNYYSFTQELSSRHQGKITGALGFTCWAGMFVLHKLVGHHVEVSKELHLQEALARGLSETQAKLLASWQAYQWSMALIGVLPLVAFFVMLLLWNWWRVRPASTTQEPGTVPEPDVVTELTSPRYSIQHPAAGDTAFSGEAS